jgi:hypothetical protein
LTWPASLEMLKCKGLASCSAGPAQGPSDPACNKRQAFTQIAQSPACSGSPNPHGPGPWPMIAGAS